MRKIEKSHRIFLNNKKIKRPMKVKKYFHKKQLTVNQKKKATNF